MTKKKNNPSDKSQKNVTILFGYALFLVSIVLITLFTVIPFGNLLFDPATRHDNIVLILVSLVAGALLPTLAAYILGDRATHKKNKASHHFNGILFGVAAYWVSLAFTFLRIETLPRGTLSEPWDTIANAWPIAATVIVMSFVAITYAHHQKSKQSVLEHRPYQFVLLASIVGFLGYVAIRQDYQADFFVPSLASLLIPVALTIVGYVVAFKNQPAGLTRLSSAAVAMTIGGISASLFAQSLAYAGAHIAYASALIVSQLFGLLVWLAYLWLVSRKNA